MRNIPAIYCQVPPTAPTAAIPKPICSRTCYAEFSRAQAILILFAIAIIIVFLMYSDLSNNKYINIFNLNKSLSDAELYVAVSERVRRGESYYQAAASELRNRSYHTNSIFNWRLPVYAWVFGKLPTPSCGRAILGASIVLAAVLACAVIAKTEGQAMQLTVFSVMIGSYGWFFHPYPAYFMEMWSGLYIYISACLIFMKWWAWGALAAVIALTLRELALPYVAVISLLALLKQRWGVFAVLILACITYLLLFGLHYQCVVHHASEAVSGKSSGWLALGGTSFILSTCQMNFLLAVLPSWCTAVYLPLSLLGLMGCKECRAFPIQLTAAAYLLIFMFVGMPFNFYWGWMCMPLLLTGFLWSPFAIIDIFKTILIQQSQSDKG